MICVVVRSLALCRYLRIAIPALVLAGLPGTAGGQVHEHATLPHNIPDFRGQSGCETVTASRDYSSSTTVECLVIESGTTRVRAGATLTADTILVLSSGGFSLEAGAHLRFRDGTLSRPDDPDQWQRGLICLGVCSLLGTEKTPTARLSAAPNAGVTTLSLPVPSDWRVGDELALHSSHQPATNHEAYQIRSDICTIASKSSTSVTCGQALRFAHPGRGPHLPLVANLTRDTTIRSANPNGVRGHIAFIGTATVEVRGVELRDMGRTTFQPLGSSNPIGRYPLHFHHYVGPFTSDPYQFVVSGNVVRGSTVRGEKWGIAVHDSHFGLVEKNVVWQMSGAGIVTEDGSETSNTIRNNWVGETWGAAGFSTDNHKSTDRASTGDWGWEGSCYWFRGPANTVTGNYCGGAVYGFSYVLYGVTVPVPTAKGQAPSVTRNMQTVPLTRFEDNEISGTFLGVNPWNLGASCCIDVFELPESFVRRTTLWNVRRGYYGYAQNRVTVEDWTHRADPSFLVNANESSYGFWWGDYIARNVILRRVRVEDVRSGVIAPYKPGDTRDVYGTATGTTLIEDSTIRAAHAIVASTMYGVTGGGSWLPPRLVTVRNTTLIGAAGTEARWVTREHVPTGYPNPNTTQPDRVRLEGVNGLTGWVYYDIQKTQNLYGGLAPSDAVPVQNIAGLFSGTGTPTPPPPPPPPPPTEICGDGIDNDLDGQVDEGCTTAPPPPPTEICGDGIDNDLDGQVDEGCTTAPPPPPTTDPPPPTTNPPAEEQCGDEVDNDGDGQVDEGCPTQSGLAVLGDFDGDRKADLTVFRASNGTWYTLHSSTQFGSGVKRAWGTTTDVSVSGDFDGDGKADVAVFRPGTGQWFILTSSSGFTTHLSFQYGAPGDIPVPADFDGDLKTDLAVYRPQGGGRWYVLTSSSNFTRAFSNGWGGTNDFPVAADFDGDKKADFAVWRPANGTWYILKSSTGNQTATSYRFGKSGDVPVPADYDGDGLADLAIYRQMSGWYLATSSSQMTNQIFTRWAYPADIPAPTDHDGDGKADLITFRPATGGWNVFNSSEAFRQGDLLPNFGQAGDRPIPSTKH